MGQAFLVIMAAVGLPEYDCEVNQQEHGIVESYQIRVYMVGPELVSNDTRATEPELIEAPIIIKKARNGHGMGVKTCANGSETGTNREHYSINLSGFVARVKALVLEV
jgi:hypothetical protein